MHLYSLKENGPLCNTLPDSRGICRELKIYGHDFSPWHVNAIERLKEYTPKVRKALEFQGVESKSNLLLHMINLFFINNGTDQAELLQVEDDKEIWVSGWPGSKNRQVLNSKIPGVSFKFLDDFLPADKRNLPAKQKVPFLLPQIIDGFCLENHGYLIKERHEYLKNSLRRAEQNYEKKGDMQHFNQHFLHTEQGVLRYLTSDLFQQKIIKIIKDHPPSREIVMVVNMASTKSVCLHCADRIFRESEWGQGFLKDLQQKAKIPLKIHFLASAYEKYVDDLKSTNDSKSLREKLKEDISTTRQKIGFDGGCRINFMGTFEGRQPFDHEFPLIAHTII
ncbi:hypothetical protein [Candidatus Paracaedibacter symbiosus]|uniref:hypothetical protein n=1 Tax=Candidatus Paracaedibacter symbiosus TaxID=244582 RepID=UPI000509DCBD|nr:hypothetical protein [Candidatus Paracaedibacter symbiosus]